jgi:hypothetical protein
MAPSRGTTKAVASNSPHVSDDVAVDQQSSSALVSAKRNLNFLINPDKANNHPSRFRTRALLRTLRYVGIFVFWRIVRYAKYVAIASIVATVGAAASGIIAPFAWLAAPPTMTAAIISASIWGVGKFGAKKLHRRWERTGKDEGFAQREAEETSPIKREGTWKDVTGPGATAW